MQTDISALPDGWRELPLKSVAEARFSNVDKLSTPGEEPVRLCNYTDVYKNDYITDELSFMRATATHQEIKRFGLQVGDVIITKDSETPDDIGIPSVVDYAAPDMVCGYHLALIRPNIDALDPTFLAKQLSHERLARYFCKQASGLTRYALSTKITDQVPLWLPDLEEQQAVASISRLIDEAIAKTEAVIGKLRQVRTGLIHDLLTCGLDENGHLRDPIAHPEHFQGTIMGLRPRDWEIAPIGIKCETYAGGTPPRGSPEFFGGDVPWIKSGEVNQDAISTTEETLSEQGLAVSSAKWIAPGNPLMAMYGATAGQVSWLITRATANQAVLAIIPRSDATFARFLFWMLRFVAPQIITLATGSGQPNLSKGLVDKALVAIPRSPDEQRSIAAIIDAAVAIEKSETANLDKLIQLKSGLMDDLLTGRVRVPNTP